LLQNGVTDMCTKSTSQQAAADEADKTAYRAIEVSEYILIMAVYQKKKLPSICYWKSVYTNL